ncbi:MAG TPA: hypothetical protein DGG94_07985, partial [Micromonosporaceae bacterium]|nr:hypothetical protein [Micromonosporaceae bacterium]
MPRRRQQTKDGRARSTRSWRKHQTALISAATAIGLLLVGAILSPVGDRLVEAIWPNTDGRAPEQSLQSPGGRLVTISRWPPQTDLECDASTKVAGLPGAPEPAGLIGSQDIRALAMDQLGAIVWYHGTLNITLTTVDAAPSLVTAIKPVIH